MELGALFLLTIRGGRGGSSDSRAVAIPTNPQALALWRSPPTEHHGHAPECAGGEHRRPSVRVVWLLGLYLGEETRAGSAGNSRVGADNAGDCVPIRSRQLTGRRRWPSPSAARGRCTDSKHFEYPSAHLCYNNNVVRMIPEFTDLPGAPWAVLPEGVHHASLSVVADRFASNARRRRLFSGLLRAARDLAQAGCKRLFLDGSFVTDKPWPGDYDACWDPCGVNRQLMDPVFSNFAEGRAAQKAKFSGEFFPSTNRADAVGRSFVDFFQIEKFSGLQKGIVLIDLTNDPML